MAQVQLLQVLQLPYLRRQLQGRVVLQLQLDEVLGVADRGGQGCEVGVVQAEHCQILEFRDVGEGAQGGEGALEGLQVLH